MIASTMRAPRWWSWSSVVPHASAVAWIAGSSSGDTVTRTSQGPSFAGGLDADDVTTLEYLGEHDAIAITVASVRTLHSIQVKGRATAIEDATDADRDRATSYREAFFRDIVETDGFDRVLLDRILPSDYVACTVVVEALYDQTPGPGAGASIAHE